MGGDDLPAEICRVIAFVGKDGSTTVVPRAHIASEINWIPVEVMRKMLRCTIVLKKC